MRQSDLADRIGVSRQSVSGWINGSVAPSAENRRQVARALGIGPEALRDDTPADLEAERSRYMEQLHWYLRPAPQDGARTGGQAAEFAFEHSLRSLAPETAQNANDEKLDTEATVDLAYTVIELSGEHLERFLTALRFDVLRPHYEAIVADRPELPISGSIRAGLEQIDSGSLILLRIADSGTTGLVGPEAGSGNFAAVMRDTLSSTKDDTKGGSYGLGKATMWASSRLGLVLAHSNLSEPHNGRTEHRVIGRLELPSHSVGGDDWDGPGWLGVPGQYGADSLWDNSAAALDLHLAREGARTGTSFLVVGAHDGAAEASTPEEMVSIIEDEILNRFWPAMLPDAAGVTRLSVTVGIERNGDMQAVRTVDPVAGRPIQAAMLTKYYAGEEAPELDEDGDVAATLAELVVPKNVSPDEASPSADHDALVIVTQLDQRTADQADVVEYMRGSKMVVDRRSVHGLAIGHRPFHAVVLAGGASAGDSSNNNDLAERFLRRAEPPEHNRWTHKTRRVGAMYYGGSTSLRKFWASVNQAIAEVVNRPVITQDNGPDCLRELLRISDVDQPPRAKEPRITVVSLDSIKPDGAWVLRAKVTVPAPSAGRQWRFRPVARFGVESGSPSTVGLSLVEALERCTTIDDDQILVNTTARTAVVRLTTDPATHPTQTRYASAGVDLRRPEEVEPA